MSKFKKILKCIISILLFLGSGSSKQPRNTNGDERD